MGVRERRRKRIFHLDRPIHVKILIQTLTGKHAHINEENQSTESDELTNTFSYKQTKTCTHREGKRKQK